MADSVHQIYTAWALSVLGRFSPAVQVIVSVGNQAVMRRAAEVAADRSWRHFHLDYPRSIAGRLAWKASITGRLTGEAREVVRQTTALIIFNDLHPAAGRIHALCPRAPVRQIEEGTGLHRTRSLGVLPQVLALGTAMPGRQGEATWVDELWVTQTQTLTPAQRRKRLVTFDRAALVEQVRRRWGTCPALPHTPQPILLIVGQPFVEDHVLSEGQLTAVADAVAGAVPPRLRAHLLGVYKPHPRESAKRDWARHFLGEGAAVLDAEIPLELMDFGPRPVFAISLTSGAVRNLHTISRSVSVARCFPALACDAGDPEIYPGVTPLRDLSQLAQELEAFCAAVSRVAGGEQPVACRTGS